MTPACNVRSRRCGQGPGTLDHLQIDTRTTTLGRDQSSLAALNIAGSGRLD